MEIIYTQKLDMDIHLFKEGKYLHCYDFLGCHKTEDGYRFAVWAPAAKNVHLTGDFNGWDKYSLPMKMIDDSGIFEITLTQVAEFSVYKYIITTANDKELYKADPFAFHAELRPDTGSKVYDIEGYQWGDSDFLAQRQSSYDKPINIYEVNLLSWRKKDNGDVYSYRELGEVLVDYVLDMGYTHVEFMPLVEHPFDGSWGYQVTGYFAPTSRYGTAKDLMYLIDSFHKVGIAVILDWVPVHFCKDAHGLYKFDGSSLFESDNPLLAENTSWGTANFDYSKPEVRSFLMGSVYYFLEKFHIDGIRADAVSFMIILGYSSEVDIKNKFGTKENLDGISFIKELNTSVKRDYPDVLLIAEESTSFPSITEDAAVDGLGFTYKWNMGWMNDSLKYITMDPVMRSGFHNALTFSISYFASENFILPLSHDEVVHGKHSLLDKMPGDYETKFKSLKLFYMYMMAHPGKKLLFMGGEFAQFIEWDEYKQLDWFLLDYPEHSGILEFTKKLNHFYKNNSPLFSLDRSFEGFEWIECENKDEGIIVFKRTDKNGESITCIFNFTPVVRKNYPVGVDELGEYKTCFTSFSYDMKTYSSHETKHRDFTYHSKGYELDITIPPLGAIYIKK